MAKKSDKDLILQIRTQHLNKTIKLMTYLKKRLKNIIK